jgi:hypothetical protein
MEFDIDVSGEDILSIGYTVCIANKDSIIKGYKMSHNMLDIISSRYNQNIYNKYKKSSTGRSLLKIRIYCIIIHHLCLLFLELRLQPEP